MTAHRIVPLSSHDTVSVLTFTSDAAECEQQGAVLSLTEGAPRRRRPAKIVYEDGWDPAVGLKSLYEFVRSSVSSSGSRAEGAEEWGPPVLLVDDLSVLLSLGVSVGAVLDFSHYCRATVCSELQGNVVMLARCDGEEEEGDGDDEGSETLLKGLTHQCSLTLHVQGLPTGFCRDIHGQVEVCWRRRQGDGQSTQKKLFQYKVHDKGASFFAPGTSSAVL
ncbi:Elongator complex protein 6 [Larimichthys crocea]|uniref:Uncharacterized protein n=1 Tax=Larimichthys crocea TaxID=215358 RepID=A0ACD3QTK9_LARCR|nr:Elongator complex protein 6 [Larimichthys crocea]